MDEQINTSENEVLTQKPISKGPKKKNLLILGGILVIIAVVVAIIFIPSKFERVKNEAVEIAGQVSSRGKDNFTIDTYPFEDTNMDPALIAMIADDSQDNALEAIRYVNEELGFNGALYDEMLETTALMGRQSEENDKYEVTWKYHPDEGLEVTYKKK